MNTNEEQKYAATAGPADLPIDKGRFGNGQPATLVLDGEIVRITDVSGKTIDLYWNKHSTREYWGDDVRKILSGELFDRCKAFYEASQESRKQLHATGWGGGGGGPRPGSTDRYYGASVSVGYVGNSKPSSAEQKFPHYFKRVPLQTEGPDKGKPVTHIDIYAVLRMWTVTDPDLQHAIKKLAVAGQRGSKNTATDKREALAAIRRGIELDAQLAEMEGEE